jgi:hypothetical protein
VIDTTIESYTLDGRDRSLDYKRCGMGFPPGSRAAEVLEPLAPLADELLLAKSSSSPFSSTSLDYLLRNLGIHTLVVIGLLTDQCIDHTVKDAADRGYRVVCLTDACQAETAERHDQALACCRRRSIIPSTPSASAWALPIPAGSISGTAPCTTTKSYPITSNARTSRALTIPSSPKSIVGSRIPRPRLSFQWLA